MTVPVPKQLWGQFFRAQFESSFGSGGGTADWNIGGNGGGSIGWRDLAVLPGSVRINPTETQIFLANAAGKRALNQQPPVPGAYETTGSFEMPFVPELIIRFSVQLWGASRTLRRPAARHYQVQLLRV